MADDLKLNLIIKAQDLASGAFDTARKKMGELSDATNQYRVAFARAWQNPVEATTLISYLLQAKSSFIALSAAGTGALNAIGQSTIGAARNIAQMRGDIEGLRAGFIRFGASVVASGAQAAQGISFDAAFADVRKVVSGSEEELKALETQLKTIAQGVSVPLQGLAEIAAFGGQLGLPTKDLGEFTRLVSEMSTAFGILPAEAGDAIGKLKNIFGLTIPQLRAFGDVINTVADNANTSERAILDVLTRAGGTAERFGLLKNETTALAAAMLSLGKPPEIAAVAMRNLLDSLQNADQQTAEFQNGLKSIGIDAKQLADDIEKSPKAALDGFLATLAALDNRARGNVLTSLLGKGEDAAVLGDLVQSLGEYQRLAKLASQEEIFSGSMARTFQEREKTVSAALDRLKNNVRVFSIDTTALFLPTIRAAADALGDLLKSLARFSEQYPNLAGFARIAIVFSSLAGAFRLLGAAIGTIVPAVGPAVGALRSLIAAASGLGVFATLRAALTGLSGVMTAVFGNVIGRAVIGVTLLTGGFHALTAAVSGAGGVIVSVLSNPLVLLLGGIAALVLRVSAAGSALGGLGVAIASTGRLLLQLAGGWIGVAISGLSFLAVKFIEVKDQTMQFAGVQTTLSEVIGATWRVITGYIGRSADAIIGWLGDITNSNAETWEKVKVSAGEAMDEWRRTIKSTVNALIGEFVGFGEAAGIGISRTIERVELKFSNLVALAKAAGKDIQAALSGDFSGSNFTAQLEQNRAANKQAYENMVADMTAAYQKAQGIDYTGAAVQKVQEFAGTVKAAAEDAIAAELNAAKKREQIEVNLQTAKSQAADTYLQALQRQLKQAEALQKAHNTQENQNLVAWLKGIVDEEQRAVDKRVKIEADAQDKKQKELNDTANKHKAATDKEIDAEKKLAKETKKYRQEIIANQQETAQILGKGAAGGGKTVDTSALENANQVAEQYRQAAEAAQQAFDNGQLSEGQLNTAVENYLQAVEEARRLFVQASQAARDNLTAGEADASRMQGDVYAAQNRGDEQGALDAAQKVKAAYADVYEQAKQAYDQGLIDPNALSVAEGYVQQASDQVDQILAQMGEKAQQAAPETTVNVDSTQVDGAIEKINSIPAEKTVTIKTVVENGKTTVTDGTDAGPAPGFAAGGRMEGPWQGDDRLIKVGGEEGVVHAAGMRTLDKQLPGFFDRLVAGESPLEIIRSLNIQQFAAGGRVGHPYLLATPPAPALMPAAATSSSPESVMKFVFENGRTATLRGKPGEGRTLADEVLKRGRR